MKASCGKRDWKYSYIMFTRTCNVPGFRISWDKESILWGKKGNNYRRQRKLQTQIRNSLFSVHQVAVPRFVVSDSFFYFGLVWENPTLVSQTNNMILVYCMYLNLLIEGNNKRDGIFMASVT